MRTFWTGLAALAITGSVAFADEKDDVAKAAKKATELSSYGFKIVVELEGVPWAQGPIEFGGEYDKATATHVKGEFMGQAFEAYRKGEKVAMKREGGEWELAGRGGGGGAGMMMGRNMKAPHEELKEFEKRFKAIKKGDKKTIDGKDCVAYEGDLTAEGAKDLLPMGRGMGGMGDAEIAANARLWIDGEGVLRRYEIVATISLTFQGNPVEMKVSRSIDVTGIGATKVEVPKDVEALFAQPDEKKDEKKDNP